MTTIGIVAEYNPFHSGHAYQIEATRRAFGDCAVAAVMSGNWVQRGDAAVFDKWTRAEAALRGGADLVLELPTVFASCSAERFARGAVSLLAASGAVDVLSFGSESGELEALEQTAACLDSEEYRAALKRALGGGVPFASARQAAATELLGAAADCLKTPNNALAVEYLRADRRLGGVLKPFTVRRVGAGHDGGDGEHPSASFLREKILTGGRPGENPASLGFNQRGVLTALRKMTPEDFLALPDCGEGLHNRLFDAAGRAGSLEEFYALVKTKRYALSRVRRLTLWSYLGLRKEDFPAAPGYLRVLGSTERGLAVLREMKGKAALPIVTKPARGRDLPGFETEARCTDLYGLCRRNVTPGGLEYTTNPVICQER